MRKEQFTGTDIPVVVNPEELAEELAGIAPGARVVRTPRINWTRVDLETGDESIETEPETLVVEGLPPDVKREDLLAVLALHAPDPGRRAVPLEERLAQLEARVAALEGGKR